MGAAPVSSKRTTSSAAIEFNFELLVGIECSERWEFNDCIHCVSPAVGGLKNWISLLGRKLLRSHCGEQSSENPLPKGEYLLATHS